MHVEAFPVKDPAEVGLDLGPEAWACQPLAPTGSG